MSSCGLLYRTVCVLFPHLEGFHELLVFWNRQHLILHTARVNGYSKVMMGDSCSRLAVKLLSNIALGRGAALASDTVSNVPSTR